MKKTLQVKTDMPPWLSDVYNELMQYIGDQHWIQHKRDLVHDVILLLATCEKTRYKVGCIPEKERLYFLIRVAKNTYVNKVVYERRTADREVEQLIQAEPENQESSADWAIIREYLGNCKDGRMLLDRIRGFSYKEIAQKYNIGNANARKRISRLRHHLVSVFSLGGVISLYVMICDFHVTKVPSRLVILLNSINFTLKDYFASYMIPEITNHLT